MISEKSLDYLITCCPWFTNLLTTYFSALLDTNYLIRDVCEDPYRPHTVLVLCWVKSKPWTSQSGSTEIRNYFGHSLCYSRISYKIITLSQWLSPSLTPSIRSFSPSQTGNYLISKCFPRWSSFDHPPCCRHAPGLHQQHQDFDQQLSRQAHHDITQQDRCLPDSCKTVQRNSRKQNIANSCAQQRLSL